MCGDAGLKKKSFFRVCCKRMPTLLNYLQGCKSGEGCNLTTMVRNVANHLVVAAPQAVPQAKKLAASQSLTQLVAAYQPPSLGTIVRALQPK